MSSSSSERPGKKSRFVTKDNTKKKKNLFVREAAILNKAREDATNAGLTPEEKVAKFEEFCTSYEDLLDQCKLITKVSDRLQNKINTANSKLEDKNVELQNTIDALTKARVGRRATTYVLIIAVVLFILTEALIEPPVERWAHDEFSPGDEVTNMEMAVGLTLKGLMALLLKPIEMIVERTMMKRAQRESQMQKANQTEANKTTVPA